MNMTRRELLAMVPAWAARKAGAAAAVPFERIDTHTHIHRSAPAFIAAMQKAGWSGLSICDSRAVGDQASDLEEMVQGTAKAHRQSQGRLAWATTFDARGFEEPDFAGRVIAGLRQGYDQNAIGVKIWKNIGMGIRSRSGEYLMPDNSALVPIYEAVQKAGKTLITHLAEPNAAWLPLGEGGSGAGYYKSHPEWHMYGRPGAPSKEAILAARDRILSRYPRLRVIGCHLGSNEEDLDRLAPRLDSFPNFAVDLASRVRYLIRGDRDKVRQFVLTYQDRIIYGTDFTLGSGDDLRAAQSLQGTHHREWDFFATVLALPETVLRKIFHHNAVRWLPGIVA
jgi:predicted TIM-barrel fold metal-dependent hydrolase